MEAHRPRQESKAIPTPRVTGNRYRNGAPVNDERNLAASTRRDQMLIDVGLAAEDPPDTTTERTGVVDTQPRTIPYFGACPECFEGTEMVRYDHFVNVRSTHYAVCE